VSVFPDVRRKLSKIIQACSRYDVRCYHLIRPWYGIFDSESFNALLVRCIIPLLRNKDGNEDLCSRVSHLLQWYVPGNQPVLNHQIDVNYRYGVIPRKYFLAILNGEYLPAFRTRLLRVLEQRDVSLAVVEYTKLRILFSRDILRDKSILRSLKELLGTLLASQSSDFERFSSNLSTTSFEKELELSFTAAPQNSHTRTFNIVESRFKDVVTEYAEMHGLVFTPNGRFTDSGQQIYIFGNDNVGKAIFIENDVVYASFKRHSDSQIWEPVSLDDLLASIVKSGNCEG